jgi:hypothetical protein
MDELEQLEEFSALMESMEMPDHLKTALIEAFNYTHNAQPKQFVIPLGVPLPEDVQQGVDYLLSQQSANNSDHGLEFNEAKARRVLEVAAHREPDKYRMTPANKERWDRKQKAMKTAAQMMMHNSQLNVLNQDDARKAYYKAFVKRVYQIYNHFHIPFDADGYYEYICAKDNANTPEVDAANAQSVVFKTFGEMITNPDIKKLMKNNKALDALEKKCYKFLVDLRDARENGTESSFLSWCRISGDVQKAPTIEKPDARLTEDDQKAFEEKEAIAKAMAERAKMPKNLSARVGSIAEMRKHFPRLPYARLYERFANGGDPARVEQAPKPDESISNYLYRMKRGGVPMDTFLRMHIADINTAYPPEAAERALNQLRYTGYVEGAERDVAEMGIDPSLQTLAALCSVIEKMRAAKENFNFEFTLP